MKPIPSNARSDADRADPVQPELLLSAQPGPHGGNNRRGTSGQAPTRAYPWLLLLSTSISAVLAWAYITKPVLISGPEPVTLPLQAPAPQPPAPQPPAPPSDPHTAGTLLPGSSLPGTNKGLKSETKPPGGQQTAETPLIPAAPVHSDYEETNLRIQHILTATSPDGQVNRIDVEVPVLYKSRNLRWSAEEIATARELLLKLMDYQDKSRELRHQGLELVEQWNALMGRSIPSKRLRADSPSMPENQLDATKSAPITPGTGSGVEIQIKQP